VTELELSSDIRISVNGVELTTRTSLGNLGDRLRAFTPDWWKLHGSQYGMLKSFRLTPSGTHIDSMRVSETTQSDLNLLEHSSIRLRVEVPEAAAHPGDVNIFGRGFGNYDQDIILRLRS
jgi:predicted transcriptional regulator